MKSTFLVCVPFTGLGLYGGFRGNRWLKNRIAIFKQFVVPSLMAQTDTDFILWVCWRNEEKNNPHVQELLKWLSARVNFEIVFTYSGIPFWDDKYEPEVARERLFQTLKGAMPELIDALGECDEVHWLLQPSDDVYHIKTVQSVKAAFQNPEIQAVGYKRGYLMNYNTLEVKEYNPKTNPPFFAIKFPRATFIDAGKHMNYTGPYISHEYVPDKLKMGHFEDRGFIVGTHGENISTHFNNPFGTEWIFDIKLEEFGLAGVQPITLPLSTRKWLMRKLPYGWQRKLRYIFGEKLYSPFYNWLRS